MPSARAFPSRMALLPGLVLAALGATAISHRADAAPKLTCTFIQKRCMTECVKQAGQGFCQLHCGGERRNCMTTGRWSSFGRNFDNVVRR